MGTACIKKEKGHKEAPMYSNSKLTMVSQDPMLNTRFSRLNCPIENLKIIDKRKEIQSNNPFEQNLQTLTKKDLESQKWKKINIPNKENGKYWYFSEQQLAKLEGIGILYYLGKYGDYLIEGQFYDNTIKNKVKYLKIYQNSDSYIGTLNGNFDPDGKGQLHYQNKNIYKGNFCFGLPHGSGELITKYGKFTGTFDKGEIIRGKLQQKYGTYEGKFQNKMKEGQGVYTSKSGKRYVGNFSRDKKNGLGQLYDSSGKLIYKGIWKDDKQQKQ